MAFDNYINFQEEILAKLNRLNDGEAVLRVPSWITLAENQLRMGLNKLMIRQGETNNQTFSIAAEYTALPTGFLRFRSPPRLTSVSPTASLEYVPPSVADNWDTSAPAGQPKLYTIQGNQLRVFPTPSTTYTATANYYALTPLSLSAPTNWLLTAHPLLYFRAVLAQAYDFYDDAENYTRAVGEREQMLSDISTADGSDQQGSRMRMKNDGGTP